jgi:hypothetical protein
MNGTCNKKIRVRNKDSALDFAINKMITQRACFNIKYSSFESSNSLINRTGSLTIHFYNNCDLFDGSKRIFCVS